VFFFFLQHQEHPSLSTPYRNSKTQQTCQATTITEASLNTTNNLLTVSSSSTLLKAKAKTNILQLRTTRSREAIHLKVNILTNQTMEDILPHTLQLHINNMELLPTLSKASHHTHLNPLNRPTEPHKHTPTNLLILTTAAVLTKVPAAYPVQMAREVLELRSSVELVVDFWDTK